MTVCLLILFLVPYLVVVVSDTLFQNELDMVKIVTASLQWLDTDMGMDTNCLK